MTHYKSSTIQQKINKAKADLRNLEDTSDSLTVKKYRQCKTTIQNRLNRWQSIFVKQTILQELINQMNKIRPKKEQDYISKIENLGQYIMYSSIEDQMNSNHTLDTYKELLTDALSLDYTDNYDLRYYTIKRISGFNDEPKEAYYVNEKNEYYKINQYQLNHQMLLAHQLILELIRLIAPDVKKKTNYDINAVRTFSNYSRKFLRDDIIWTVLTDKLTEIIDKYDLSTRTINDRQLDPDNKIIKLIDRFFDSVTDHGNNYHEDIDFGNPNLTIDLENFNDDIKLDKSESY